MKFNSSFVPKLAAVAAAVACVGSASATGTFTVAGGSTVRYATEAVGPATPITLPSLVYQMGVSRSTTGQDFAIIYRLPAGSTFAGPPPLPTYTPAGLASVPDITLKRGGQGTGEVVFSVSPRTNPVAVNDTFTFAPGIVNTHGMVGNGATYTMSVQILDQNETACVDNVGTPAFPGANACILSAVPGSLAQASNFLLTVGGLIGVTADDGSTTTDVRATVPLAGFVADTSGTGPNDDTNVARAQLITKNRTAGVRNPTNTADYVLTVDDDVTIRLTDPTGFLGRSAAGPWFDIDNDNTRDANETFAISGNEGTLLIDGNLLPNNAARTVHYPADGTIPMGVSRIIAANGFVNPDVAGVANLAFAGNNNWWEWRSNGIVLETPFFTTFAGLNSRFAFMNYGLNDVSYTADCLVENGNTRTLGPASSGPSAVFLAGRQTVIQATNLCTFSGNTRASIRFTINAPASVIKGVYNVVNEANGSQTTIELLPPRAN